MDITRFFSLFGWSILLIGAICYVIRLAVFKKKGSSEDLNLAEALYLSVLIIASGIIIYEVIRSISIAYDVHAKLNANFFWPFVKTGSVLSIVGVAILLLSVFLSKILSMIFFGKRKDAVELTSNNYPFIITRCALLLVVSYILVEISSEVFNYLLPDIKIPFYR